MGSQEGRGSGDPTFGLLGCFGLFLRFWAVLGYFWAFCRKNAFFGCLGLKWSKMSVFFIENNFWNNISARDVSPRVVLWIWAHRFRIIKKKPSIFHPITMSPSLGSQPE